MKTCQKKNFFLSLASTHKNQAFVIQPKAFTKNKLVCELIFFEKFFYYHSSLAITAII